APEQYDGDRDRGERSEELHRPAQPRARPERERVDDHVGAGELAQREEGERGDRDAELDQLEVARYRLAEEEPAGRAPGGHEYDRQEQQAADPDRPEPDEPT